MAKRTPIFLVTSIICTCSTLFAPVQSREQTTSRSIVDEIFLTDDDLKLDIIETVIEMKELENNILWSRLGPPPPRPKAIERSVYERNDMDLDAKVKIDRKLQKKVKYKGKSKKKTKVKRRKTGKGIHEPCPDPHSDVLHCAPMELHDHCDKYGGGDFMSCYMDCKQSFCCIHDSLSTTISPSCSQEPNCKQYSDCYIVWWKLHDTIGPATYLNVGQNDDFFNMGFEDIRADLSEDFRFFQQLFGHHFDQDDDVKDDQFYDPENW